MKIYNSCRCILKLDHHSLLTGNCIGKNNYKYFMSYVFYAFINAGLLMLLSCADLWRVVTFDFKVPYSKFIYKIIYILCFIFIIFVFFFIRMFQSRLLDFF